MRCCGTVEEINFRHIVKCKMSNSAAGQTKRYKSIYNELEQLSDTKVSLCSLLCMESSIARAAFGLCGFLLFVIIYRFYGCPSCSAVGSTTIRQILLSAAWLLIFFCAASSSSSSSPSLRSSSAANFVRAAAQYLCVS